MNLHEYQAKAVFREHGLPVQEGIACRTMEEATQAARTLGGSCWVCKVQVHAGGRGKAGGVKLTDRVKDVTAFAEKWLGQRIVTAQTDAAGQPVDVIYLERGIGVGREIYLGMLIDRAAERVVAMASSEGGMDIETIAETQPENIFRKELDPLIGAQAWQGRDLGYRLGFEGAQNRVFTKLFLDLGKLFHECDASLVEINPLVVTKEGEITCLDAKMAIDGNAAFRQEALFRKQDPRQVDPREAEAAKFGLSYVALDGSIGCMVNGAGLAMGTMDTVKLAGGTPANFLDVGGDVTVEAVSEAFRIILSDPKVRVLLINVFGGIVSCETIASGIMSAVEEKEVAVPVVVRFDGNHAREGAQILAASTLDISVSEQLSDAARMAVELAA